MTDKYGLLPRLAQIAADRVVTPMCPGINQQVQKSLLEQFERAAKEYEMSADLLKEKLRFITEKCEQYWNEDGLCDAEVHAALECIHRWAREAALAAQPEPGETREVREALEELLCQAEIVELNRGPNWITTACAEHQIAIERAKRALAAGRE